MDFDVCLEYLMDLFAKLNQSENKMNGPKGFISDSPLATTPTDRLLIIIFFDECDTSVILQQPILYKLNIAPVFEYIFNNVIHFIFNKKNFMGRIIYFVERLKVFSLRTCS